MVEILVRAILALSLTGAYSRAAAQDATPISYESLRYPTLARMARIGGPVILGFTVDSDGKPASVEVISGHPLLAPAAKANLATWRFPAPKSVAPVDQRRITYVFEFSNESANGYYDPKKESFVFEGPNLVRLRTAPWGTIYAKDCPEASAAAPSGPIVASNSVTLARSGCFGTCPSYEVTLFGNGRVEWKGHGFVEARGKRTYRIEPDLAREILQLFRAPEVLNLCGDYSQSITDTAASMTEIALGSARKKIYDYADSSPSWFRQLLWRFDDATQTHSMRHGDPVTEPLIHIQGEYLPKPGQTDLMRAAAKGDLEKVKSLIAADARLEDTDASGWTALMYAAASSIDVLDELVRAGANRNHRSPFGDTVFMASALTGFFDADLAVDAGIINAQNRDGVTALMLLASGGRVDEIQAALEAGANAKLRDKRGRSALDYLNAIACHKSLVRGYKQLWQVRGPCSEPDEEMKKARRLLLSVLRAK